MADKIDIDKSKLPEIQKEYVKEIDNNIEYSLVVDPTGEYGFTKKEKEFIKNYVDLKDVEAAAAMSDMELLEAMNCYRTYAARQEISRLNRAIYHRTFVNKLLTLDEIGGYLSSVLTDQVPTADKLSGREKLAVAKMIIDLNNEKAKAVIQPEVIDLTELDKKLEKIGTNGIKSLIESEIKEDKK